MRRKPARSSRWRAKSAKRHGAGNDQGFERQQLLRRIWIERGRDGRRLLERSHERLHLIRRLRRLRLVRLVSASGSASTPFAVLSDLSSMQLVAPLSESEIGHVQDGQLATVTVEALEGRKLAAHVGEVATLSTSNSGVVSYDVTFQLDQMTPGLKPGMSATAEVVVKQEEGVNVPTSAISGRAVTVVRNGKQARRPVVTGLAGNSSTIVLSGLKAGEEIALPLASTSSGAPASPPGSPGAPAVLGGGALGGGFARWWRRRASSGAADESARPTRLDRPAWPECALHASAPSCSGRGRAPATDEWQAPTPAGDGLRSSRCTTSPRPTTSVRSRCTRCATSRCASSAATSWRSWAARAAARAR